MKTIVLSKNVEQIRSDGIASDGCKKIEVSSKNKHYVEKNGFIYSKQTGQLVIGVVRNKTLLIPNNVTKIELSGIIEANKLQTVIVPETVKEMDTALEDFAYRYIDTKKLNWFFMSPKFPKLLDVRSFDNRTTIWVRRGCKEKCLKQWDFLRNEDDAEKVKELPF